MELIDVSFTVSWRFMHFFHVCSVTFYVPEAGLGGGYFSAVFDAVSSPFNIPGFEIT